MTDMVTPTAKTATVPIAKWLDYATMAQPPAPPTTAPPAEGWWQWARTVDIPPLSRWSKKDTERMTARHRRVLVAVAELADGKGRAVAGVARITEQANVLLTGQRPIARQSVSDALSFLEGAGLLRRMGQPTPGVPTEWQLVSRAGS